MGEVPFAVGEVDLDALDLFLASDAGPEDCMQISDLDGFLTGIAIGPEPVTPSEWLPAVWGGEEPVFDDAEQARTVIGAIMGRYNEILRVLNSDPEAYEPLFWENQDGEVIAADWVTGETDAMLMVVAREVAELQRVLVRLSTRGGAARVMTLLRLEELKPASPLPLEATR